MRVGLIGCGAWGRNYLQFSPNAVFDEPLPYKHRFRDLCHFLHSVDAVVVATPSPTHAYYAQQALSRNKHVLVEKPMAMTPAEAVRLERVAADHKVTLMVGHVALYSD